MERKNIKISVFTLGCKTNYYESGQIVNWLSTRGYGANEGLKWADIFVINTCAITKEAESKSRQAIARARKLNPNCACFIVGCASEKNKRQFADIDNVVAVLGTQNKLSIVHAIEEYCATKLANQHTSPQLTTVCNCTCSQVDEGQSTTLAQPVHTDINSTISHIDKQHKIVIEQNNLTDCPDLDEKDKIARQQTSISKSSNNYCYTHTIDAKQGHTRAFIKIQDGCNNFCSYCIVPYLRSRSRSRTIDSIMQEVQVNSSADEIVLIGIDISQYGLDINTTLAQLLTRMQTFKGRVRLGSLYCNCIDEQLLEAMSVNACKHFHLSLQSGCDNTLSAMNRHYTTEQFAKSVQLIRKYYPNAGITTDIIVAFAGESQQDLEQTVAFAQSMQFSDIHIFPYSPREGTKAYGLPRPSSVIARQRVDTLSAVKRTLKREFIKKQFALDKAQVLIEEYKNGYYVGYTDNYVKVFVKSPHTITGIVECDLLNFDDEGIYAQPSSAD